MADDLKRTQRRDVIERTRRSTQRFSVSDAGELREIAPELVAETDDAFARLIILVDGVPVEGDPSTDRWMNAAGKAWHYLRSQHDDVARRLAPALGADDLFSCDIALVPPAPEWAMPRGAVLLKLARTDRAALHHAIETAFAR